MVSLKFNTQILRLFVFITVAGFITFLQSSESFSATIDYTYDDLGRLITVSYSNGTQITYSYDGAGNRTAHTEDDSGLPFPVEFVVEGGAVLEGGNITFTITKIGSSTSSNNVSYATLGDTATEGTDYTGASGTLTFPASSTNDSQTVAVATISDTTVEGLELFFFDLSSPTNGAVISVSQADGYILNDENPPPPPPPTNNPPVGGHQDYDGDKGSTITVNIVGSDPDGDAIIATEVTQQPAKGSVTITSDQKKLVLFFWGTDGLTYDFSYTIEDPYGLSDTSTGTLIPHDTSGGGGTLSLDALGTEEIAPEETSPEGGGS